MAVAVAIAEATATSRNEKRYSARLTELLVLEHADTDIGTIYFGRRPARNSSGWIYEIEINGLLLMSSSNPVSERRLSTSALELHSGDGLRVLVGGLGLGHTAQALLASPRVASVRVVEKLDSVIDWMKRGVLPLSAELVADDRFELVQGDVYSDLLGSASETFDLVLVDVDHSCRDRLSETSEPFYTEAGQGRVARHLKPGGLLGVWSAEDDDDFLDVLTRTYPRAHREHVEWEDEGLCEGTLHDVLFFGRMGADE